MAKTIVVKIGSSSLTDPQGKLDSKNLKRIVAEIVKLIAQNNQIVLVTSGAIVCGAEKLGLGKPKTIPEKQAAAAVGQSRLMRQYEKAFEKFGLTTAQILLSSDVIANQERYQNARHTFATLMKENVVPIVNENDTVATDEIKIGDNDTLAALTAALIGAKTLLILTDVDYFYDKTGKPLYEVKEITAEIEAAADQPKTQHGTGGMITKIRAYKNICRKDNIKMILINGRKRGLLKKALDGNKRAGTVFST